MRINLLFAWRYLFSGKKRNVIHVISGIAMTGIGIGAFALIVVLSAFNGLEELVSDLYSSFDADIEITPAEGKVFDTTLIESKVIEEISQKVTSKSFVLEETAMLKYGDNQVFAKIKGVDLAYLQDSGLDTLLFEGNLDLGSETDPRIMLGYGLSYKLSVFLRHISKPVTVYSAKRGANIRSNMDNAFKIVQVLPSAVFDVNPEVNYTYALVNYPFSQKLLDYEGKATALELRLKPNADIESIKSHLKESLGADFVVKTKYELNEILYKTNNTEKWITFFILIFILLIATFNVIGSITMLILDKREDIFILRSLGMTAKQVRGVFLTEGFLITFIGGFVGLLLGLILTLVQKHIGLLKLQEGTIAEYYPVAIEALDVLAVLLAIVLIALLASYFPSRFLLRKMTNTQYERVKG